MDVPFVVALLRENGLVRFGRAEAAVMLELRPLLTLLLLPFNRDMREGLRDDVVPLGLVVVVVVVVVVTTVALPRASFEWPNAIVLVRWYLVGFGSGLLCLRFSVFLVKLVARGDSESK